MYLLSNGVETESRKLYLYDALRFAFSISSNSIPNSALGVDINSRQINESYKLLFTNICKTIDPNIVVTSITSEFDKIIIRLKSPYGVMELIK